MDKEKGNDVTSSKYKKKIDAKVILSIIGIIVLTLVAALPPVLRVVLEDRRETPVNPTSTPTPTSLANGTLVCAKEEVTDDIITNLLESYYFTNRRVTIIETIDEKSLTENSVIPHSDLVSSCTVRADLANGIEGLFIYCNDEETGKVVETETIDYSNLDIYVLENMYSEIELEFTSSPTLSSVISLKEQQGYTCLEEQRES